MNIMVQGGINVNIFIAVFSIVLVTVILIALTHFRHLCRQRQQIFRVNFPDFQINIRAIRIFWIVTMSISVIPKSCLKTCPPISYTMNKNGKPILNIPNFWFNKGGFAIGRLLKTDKLTLDMKIKTPGKNNVYSFQMFCETLFN